MCIKLIYKNYPKEDGTYWAGNNAVRNNRLEIEPVLVDEGNVYIDCDSGTEPYILTDFDYWSDRVAKDFEL